jgi:hypothetical protein
MASSVKDLSFQDSDLETARQQFEEYADGTINSRALAEKCRDYRDGKQWTSEEQETLKKRKQPCITDNKIQDKCDTLLGIEKQMRTDPKAFPRNPDDEEAAEAATDSLRFVADQSDFNRTVRKPAADNLMVEGLCAGHVIVEKKKGKGYGKGQSVKVCMEHIRWDRVYYDIHSLREDFDDKSYCGYFRWMDADAAKREFKGREDAIEEAVSASSVSGPDKSLDDKPRFVMTVRNRPRVQVFKHYMLKDGTWHEGVWCSGGWLEDLKPCAYTDEYGEPKCCMELQALYRDADGNAYGSVPRYLDLQDEHNKRRSKMLHLLNAKRVTVVKGVTEDINRLRAEIHRPDGVIEIPVDDVNKGIKVEDNINEAEGQWRLLQQTDLALSQTGPNMALMGQSGDISGRAKQLDQQSGSLPISPLFEALDGWEVRMFRQAWCRIKQYWTAEMWIRVTDDENKVRFVGLNQPVTFGDQMAESLRHEQMAPEEKTALVQQIAADPASRQPYVENGKQKIKNNVAEMDVDIIIDRTQDTVNIQQEQFEMLASIAERRPEVPFKVLVEMSQLRSDVKKRVQDTLTGENDPAAQQAAQFQQMMQQLQGLLMQADVRDKNAAAAQKEAAAVESHIDAAVKTATFTNGNEQAGQPGGKPAAGKTSVAVN